MQVRAKVRDVGVATFASKGVAQLVDAITLEFEHPIAILEIQCSKEQTAAGIGAVYRPLIGKAVVVPLYYREFKFGGAVIERWALAGDGKPLSGVNLASAAA